MTKPEMSSTEIFITAIAIYDAPFIAETIISVFYFEANMLFSKRNSGESATILYSEIGRLHGFRFVALLSREFSKAL